MFTGIIEQKGLITRIVKDQSNVHFLVESNFFHELKIDQSISHDGVCLTVTKVVNGGHWVTAIDETIKKSNLGGWKVGNAVNLERCMVNNGRFDGHIVQGHVDQTGVVTAVTNQSGSWLFTFQFDTTSGNVTVEKGSISINGVSLTCFNSMKNSFTVAVIPYTFEHTNFQTLRKGDIVNLEFDIIGKYVKRLMNLTG